jgi:hypothetical protein
MPVAAVVLETALVLVAPLVPAPVASVVGPAALAATAPPADVLTLAAAVPLVPPGLVVVDPLSPPDCEQPAAAMQPMRK